MYPSGVFDRGTAPTSWAALSPARQRGHRNSRALPEVLAQGRPSRSRQDGDHRHPPRSGRCYRGADVVSADAPPSWTSPRKGRGSLSATDLVSALHQSKFPLGFIGLLPASSEHFHRVFLVPTSIQRRTARMPATTTTLRRRLNNNDDVIGLAGGHSGPHPIESVQEFQVLTPASTTPIHQHRRDQCD